MAQPALEGLARLPPQLAPRLGGVDRIASIVTGPVFHERDEVGIAALFARPQLVEQGAQLLHQVYVAPLAVAAQIVGLSGTAALQHSAHALAMVQHVYP